MLFYDCFRIEYRMIKLQALVRDFYTVKEGDSAESIARAANVSPLALKKLNGIGEEEEVREGVILQLPPSGNLYTVQPGDDAVTLCGSVERFESLNGTRNIFPGMKARI